MDAECSLKDLPEVMDDRDEWQERVREIRASTRLDDDDDDDDAKDYGIREFSLFFINK